MTTRIVHVLHHSASALEDAPLDRLLSKDGWHVITARHQQRLLEDVAVECWRPERRLKLRRWSREVDGIRETAVPALSLGYKRELAPAIFARIAELQGPSTAVFVHGTTNYLCYALLARFSATTRIILQNHGEQTTAALYAGRRGPVDLGLRIRLERRYFPRAHRVFYLNDKIAADYRAQGVPHERLVHGTMGVDRTVFRPLGDDIAERRAEARARLGLPAHQVCLGFAGRLSHEKNTALLVDAMDHLPGIGLVVVGEGPLRGALESQRTTLAHPERIRFVGHLRNHEELNTYYNAFDLLVLPSLQEGFGMVIAEAMAAGTPTLAADLPGTRELIGGGGRAGHLTEARTPSELADAISGALAAPPSPEALAEAAAARSWEHICSLHADALELRCAS